MLEENYKELLMKVLKLAMYDDSLDDDDNIGISDIMDYLENC